MYLPTIIAYLTVLSSIFSIQGQTNLQIYNPQRRNQTADYNVALKSTNRNDKLRLVDLPLYWVPCICEYLQCSCCIGIRFRKQNIDKRVCIQITLVVSTMRLQVTITLGMRLILNMSVSILTPPAICIPTFLPIPVYLCLKIHDIVLPIGTDFEACLSLLLKFFAQEIYQLNLGCIRLGESGSSFFRPLMVEQIASSEDDREDVIRGDNDGISQEGFSL